MLSDSPTLPLRTSFGRFVPCDRDTYRKLKRIRHLAAFAEVDRRRWDRSQRRLPKNRVFIRRRGSAVVREPVDALRMIFAPFYGLRLASHAGGMCAAYPPDARLAEESELMARFMNDYHSARHPVANPADIRPLSLSATEIDALLQQIELWNLRR
jgi:hypothetical protein